MPASPKPDVATAAYHLRRVIRTLKDDGKDGIADAVYETREALFALLEDSFFDETPERAAAAERNVSTGLREARDVTHALTRLVNDEGQGEPMFRAGLVRARTVAIEALRGADDGCNITNERRYPG